MSGLLRDFERLGLVGAQPPRRIVKRLQLGHRPGSLPGWETGPTAGRAGDEPWSAGLPHQGAGV